MTQIFPEGSGSNQQNLKPRRRRSRSTRQYIGAVVSLFAILFVVMATVIAWPRISSLIAGAKFSDYKGTGNGTEVIVTVPKDASGTEIGSILEKAGVVASTKAFTTAFEENPRANSIQAGTFKLQLKMSGVNAVSALLDPASRAELRVTIPEGFRSVQVYERLASVLGISLDEVKKAAEDTAYLELPPQANGSIEGWIAPLTYEFTPSTTAKDALKTMVAHRVEFMKGLGISPDRWERILTIASIAEREVSYPDEYGKVARVIENRLVDKTEVHGKLQMESTVLYALGKSVAVPTSEDLKFDSPYNTHLHTGLPPTPISNPSTTAIEAAMNPPAGDWLYFVTVNLDTGETKFSSTYEEHKKYVEEFAAWYQKNRR